MKEKHIENLSKGKKSGMNIGSRATPHRLKPYEQEQFTRAIRYRLLRVPFDSRVNVVNIWRKYCQAKNWACVILFQQQNGGSICEYDGAERVFACPKEAVRFAKCFAKRLT